VAAVPRIAVVGSYGAGLTMTLARSPAAGETVRATAFAQGPGGKGSNQAIGAARLGAEVALCTVVGPDAFGEQARTLFAAEGVDATHVATGTRPTMVAFILVEEDGENRIAIAPGALDELTPAHVEAFAPQITAADVLVTGLEIPVAPAVAALRIARAAGIPTILNPAPAVPLPDGALALVDHLTPNRTEAAVLTGRSADAPPDELLDALRELVPARGVVVLTLGSDGAIVDDGATRTAVAPVAVDAVVDTAGAGDAFTAGYAVSIAEGLAPQPAAHFAAGCGAFAVTRAECVPGLGRRAEIAALLG
jgi:ribokinase